MKTNKILLSLLPLTFIGCSTQPSGPVKPVEAPVPAVEILVAKPAPTLQASDPEQKIRQAQDQENWQEFSRLIHQEWALSGTARKHNLEQRLWQVFSALPREQLQTLIANDDYDSAAWATLALAAQNSPWQRQALLEDLTNFYPESIIYQDFLPNWQAQNQTATLQNIAVLLPMQGRYEQFSQDIKNGIIKAFYAHGQDATQLRFYDSSNLETIAAIHQQAVQDGAQRIIGPLQKEAIERLVNIADDSTLVLNTYESDAPFYQFSLKSSNELAQLISGMEAFGQKSVGIMTSPRQQDIAFTEAFTNAWLRNPEHYIDIATSNEKERDLRKLLGKLMNEINSQERYRELRQHLGKMEFQPRVRQDFDALLFIDQPHNIAVYNPQLTFYQSDVKVYANSNLTPKKESEFKDTPDFKNIRMVNTGLALDRGNLNNIFEAFGWDSYWSAQYLPALQEGYCLKIGKTGELLLNGKELQQSLIWTVFNEQGHLKRLNLSEQTSNSNDSVDGGE